MEIFGNVIDDKEIIGISNLNRVNAEASFSDKQVYEPIRLRFDVFTKQNIIKIESDRYPTNGITEKAMIESVKSQLQFQMMYIETYKKIWNFVDNQIESNHSLPYPRYITEMEKEVKKCFVAYKIDQQKKEN
jgi:hypothetical protein